MNLDLLGDREDFKNSFFRVLLLMRGSKRILVFYDPKDNKEEEIAERKTLQFAVNELGSSNMHKLFVPTFQVSKCFPPCYL